MRDNSSHRGFSLVELIIVIVIIGVLAMIAVPQYGKIVEKSRITEAVVAMNALRGAQLRYMAEYDAYAATASSIDTDIPASKYFCDTADSPCTTTYGFETGSPKTLVKTKRNSLQNSDLGNYELFLGEDGSLRGRCSGTAITKGLITNTDCVP